MDFELDTSATSSDQQSNKLSRNPRLRAEGSTSTARLPHVRIFLRLGPMT